jgi:hypothetical protein
MILEQLERLGFNVSLDKRQGGTGWAGKWRFRILPNKQERQDYRITAYGDTAAEAITAGLARHAEIQREWAKSWATLEQ